jgi:hypothetical protein
MYNNKIISRISDGLHLFIDDISTIHSGLDENWSPDSEIPSRHTQDPGSPSIPRFDIPKIILASCEILDGP